LFFSKKRPGSKKRKKNRHLKIHDTLSISPENISEGSRFKGYDDYIASLLEMTPKMVSNRGCYSSKLELLLFELDI